MGERVTNLVLNNYFNQPQSDLIEQPQEDSLDPDQQDDERDYWRDFQAFQKRPVFSSFDAMLSERRKVLQKHKDMREQAYLEYEQDFQEYLKLAQMESQIMQKFGKPVQETSLPEIITDLANFKIQWYMKRVDSQVKNKIFGQNTFDADVVQSNLDTRLLAAEVNNKVFMKTEEAKKLLFNSTKVEVENQM